MCSKNKVNLNGMKITSSSLVVVVVHSYNRIEQNVTLDEMNGHIECPRQVLCVPLSNTSSCLLLDSTPHSYVRKPNGQLKRVPIKSTAFSCSNFYFSSYLS